MAQRHTTRRNRHRKMIAKDEPPCHICGGPILYDIDDHLHPLSFTIDHIVPLARGGTDTIDNVAACHRRCNQSRYTKPLPGQVLPPKPEPQQPGLPPGVTFVTTRDWWSKPDPGRIPGPATTRPSRA